MTPLATQVVPPAPPAILVERARLLARLDSDPITLVRGPLGSGKTSLLASWAESAGPVAWLSLTEADDHPPRLWSALLVALGEAPAALGLPDDGPDLPFLARFVNVLAAAPQILVLDDVHLLQSAACRRQLGFVVAHLPPTVRLLMGSRDEPRLPLQDARLRGRLCEVAPHELAFTEAETAQLLAAHGIELPAPLVAALHARTEGWAAALRLATISLCDSDDRERVVREFAGDDRAVADYLQTEVLDLVPPARRRFLLRTAIVDRVCGDLADALTEDGAGHDTLAELRRTNALVIPLDRREHWYRYQGLFGDLLRTRAERELSVELPLLRGRAARWYVRAGEPREALRHALAAGDSELACDLLRTHWFDLLAHGGPLQVRALLAQLPPGTLAVAERCIALELGEAEPGEETEPLAALLHARDPEAVAGAARRLDGADGAVAAAIELRRGVEALWAGALDRAARHLERAADAGFAHLAVVALGHLALLELWRRGPDAAEPPARRALELAAREGWTGAPVVPALVAAAASATCGLRLSEARARSELAGEVRDPRIARLSGAVADGRWGFDATFSGRHVEVAVREALDLDALGRTADADVALEHALAAAEASGHRIMFLAGGERMVELLRRRIRAGTQHRAVVGDLLTAFSTGETDRPTRAPLREPLSARELTVLRYLPTFLPTREIASELFVSPNTVKSHLRSIYRKLDVQCRREAIDRARELRLLSSR